MCNDTPIPPPRVACVITGETNPDFVELHDVGGVQVPLCKNCYRRLVELFRIQPRAIWDPPDQLEQIGHALLAESELLIRLAESRWSLGHLLIDRVHRDAPEDGGDEV